MVGDMLIHMLLFDGVFLESLTNIVQLQFNGLLQAFSLFTSGYPSLFC